MPCCSALTLLRSENPLRGRKLSPKALQSVLKPPSRIYKPFCTLLIHPDADPLDAGTAEMCPCHKGSSRRRASALDLLARAGFIPCAQADCSGFPVLYFPGLVGKESISALPNQGSAFHPLECDNKSQSHFTLDFLMLFLAFTGKALPFCLISVLWKPAL